MVPKQSKFQLFCYRNVTQLLLINMKIKPAHAIMVLITQATSECSGEAAHPRSLARAFAARTHEVWK